MAPEEGELLGYGEASCRHIIDKSIYMGTDNFREQASRGTNEYAHLLTKTDALDHKNDRDSTSIATWQTRVSKWYSTSSNSTQTAVAPPSTEADILLFLHKNTSAATKSSTIKLSNSIL